MPAVALVQWHAGEEAERSDADGDAGVQDTGEETEIKECH
jgi:hypothetical protein